ncbi:hypothetical protein GCM10007938_13150 [Vibrio zhanjiangensis]|uniref:Uncharacterized protein n=1 Tax=Vibrio zhanjiangensis TaxID=1046128 RepID=A0ABQ6EWZ3_9VIBR|nr:hypothetical protein [Vibrio zhanjiangensis]GLT17537.1 hypothetical protein GCM10007938_13150 [Vibrio zhanjiangensis]
MNIYLFSLISRGIKESTKFHLMMDGLMLTICICVPQMIFFMVPAISEQISLGTLIMTVAVFFVALVKLGLMGWWSTEDERQAV